MRIVKGSLLDAAEVVIAHGCNSQGVMGAGVALALKKKWPAVFDEYQREVDSGWNSLGDVSYADIEDPSHIVANIITQLGIGAYRREANYAAVLEGLRKVLADHDDVKTIAIPRIGCGLGGCDWDVMRVLLEDFEKVYNVELVLYDL